MKISKKHRTRSWNNSSCENEGKGKYDKLSELPEPILHHILSFLDMKYVIQTSMLSSRWRHLWSSLPYLDFSYLVFTQCLESNTKNYPYRGFTKFVSRVFSFRDSSSPIQKLVLSSQYVSCDTSHVNMWIRASVRRNIQTLDLQFYPKSSLLQLPQCLFNCKTLTSLALDLGLNEHAQRIVIPLPHSINLPVLRYMLFRSIGMMSTEYIDKLLSGCPVLETLVLMRCHFVDSNCFTISSPLLKRLELDLLEQFFISPYSWRITVYAPNLVSIRCKDFFCHDYSFEDISSLETAEMEMEPGMIKFLPDDDDAKHMVKWLKQLCKVKTLILNDTFLKAFGNSPKNLGLSFFLFLNLRCLELATLMDIPHLQMITYILEKAPGIEVLVIQATGAIGNAPKDFGLSFFSFPNLRFLVLEALIDTPHLQTIAYILEKTPGIEVLVVWATGTFECPANWGEGLSLPHLVSIKVYGVQGCDGEIDFLEKLLLKAPTLKEMTIFATTECFSDIPMFNDEISTCPRASANARICVHHMEP